jgi:two-component system, NarL family, sensor histidine kinase NreB
MTESQTLLKRMIVSAINAREVESARVSRLLHDEVGQVLSAVGLQMDVLKLDFKAKVPEIVERIHEIQKMLEHAVEQVRALSYDLNPAVVERAGLPSALDRLAGRFRSQFPGTVRFQCDPNIRLPLEIANVWYKIAELALENAVQHARAARIELSARTTKKSVVLEVRDDGCGFSPEDANVQTPGLGLLLIEHYAAQVPIDVSLRSQPGKGTTVRVVYPAQKSETRRNTDDYAI